MKHFIDSNGKQVSPCDHVHHVSRVDHSKYDDRRGLVLEILRKNATVWFYDTRMSETVKQADLTRVIY